MKLTREQLRVVILSLKEHERKITNSSRATNAEDVESVRALIIEFTEVRGRTMK